VGNSIIDYFKMQNNFESLQEVNEFVKNELERMIPKHICYWCGNFDFRGKTIQEVAAH